MYQLYSLCQWMNVITAVEVPQSIEHIGVVSSREKHQQDNPVIGRFGSFTAQFSDGMTLSMSCFGPAGEPPNG